MWSGCATTDENKGSRTTLPASPPAIRANPMNKINLALHTALESPKPSSPRTLSLSMMLMTRYPRNEQMPGIQSTNVTCTGGSESESPHGEWAWADRTAASMKVQFAKANFELIFSLVTVANIVGNVRGLQQDKLPAFDGVFLGRAREKGSNRPSSGHSWILVKTWRKNRLSSSTTSSEDNCDWWQCCGHRWITHRVNSHHFEFVNTYDHTRPDLEFLLGEI